MMLMEHVLPHLLVRYFNYINQNHFYYIPDRVRDGYGASKKLFQKLIIKKTKINYNG